MRRHRLRCWCRPAGRRRFCGWRAIAPSLRGSRLCSRHFEQVSRNAKPKAAAPRAGQRGPEEPGRQEAEVREPKADLRPPRTHRSVSTVITRMSTDSCSWSCSIIPPQSSRSAQSVAVKPWPRKGTKRRKKGDRFRGFSCLFVANPAWGYAREKPCTTRRFCSYSFHHRAAHGAHGARMG